ncbi:hypothetical protein P8C59_001102 [Phyllachora maydis]|uniref:Uncharacterized protein n=1 Tax=Phyllachora maydis TaxID=1825666 RepID=A0AAD9M8M0_9PEZI|nr:hypothetical protein P8C59_001102 [Phyllachora maydis]
MCMVCCISPLDFLASFWQMASSPWARTTTEFLRPHTIAPGQSSRARQAKPPNRRLNSCQRRLVAFSRRNIRLWGSQQVTAVIALASAGYEITLSQALAHLSVRLTSPLLEQSISQETYNPLGARYNDDDDQKSRQQTLETLAAPETARLTMHAGHTPSHSMSVVPTSVPSAVSTAASSGGCTTPLACQDHMTPLKSGAADEDDRRDSSVSMSEPAEPVEPAPSQQAQTLSRMNDEELEIPLRIKKSSNFGAPFGERR